MPLEHTVEDTLTRFVHDLRHRGVRISTAEVLDALSALQQVPVLQKEAFRAALKATLIKDMNALQAFQNAFAVHFATPEEHLAREVKAAEAEAARAQMIQQAEEELTFQGETLGLSAQEKEFYAGLQEHQRQRIREFLQKTSEGKNVDAGFMPMVESLVRGHLEYWRRKLENNGREPDGEGEGGMSGTDGGIRDELKILYTDMKNINERDLPRVARIIRKLARRLATRMSRRYRHSPRMARVDLRRTIRQNITKGGTLFYLKYKARRRIKPRLILFCDVSGSMSKYTNFVLQFTYGLARGIRQIESFVFGEELERVTAYFRPGKQFSEVAGDVVTNSRVWGEGTNMGRALACLRERYGKMLNDKAVVLVVSDGKTVAPEQALVELEQLRRMVKKVIWLNTLPRKEWDRYRAIRLFRQQVAMVECNTINNLEQVLRRHFLG